MILTIGDWKNEWIEANGETNELEVFISYNNSEECIYEGNFAGIPEELEDKKVISNSKILDSSVVERIGVYLLKI